MAKRTGFVLGRCWSHRRLRRQGDRRRGRHRHRGSSGVPQAQGGYWTGPQAKSHKVDLLLVVDNSSHGGQAGIPRGSVPSS